MPTLSVSLTNAVGSAIPEREVVAAVQRTVTAEGGSLDSVAVSFVTAEVIAALNLQHRGKSRPTDVLSYPFDDSFPGNSSGGELVICPREAAKGASAAGHLIEEELVLLAVHGTLHLLGYEDETEAGRVAMEQRTADILRTLNEEGTRG